MILAITPNAAVDKTYRIERFSLDRVNRPSQTFTVAGGKGINLARVYQTLGGTAFATGFLGGANGSVISRSLETEGILSEFVQVHGESRVCIAVIDPTTGSQTEINENGPTVTGENTQDLVELVRTILSAQSMEFLVLCGSIPPGTPDNLYADLIELARSFEIPSVLDATGESLRIGLETRPWMVKPNLPELEALIGRPLADRGAQIAAINNLHTNGVEVIALTLGAGGALASAKPAEADHAVMWKSTPPPIKFASAVASGDSFLAAFLWSWNHGVEIPQDSLVYSTRVCLDSRVEAALRLGTGAGAANAAEIGAGFCSNESIRAAAKKTNTRRLAM